MGTDDLWRQSDNIGKRMLPDVSRVSGVALDERNLSSTSNTTSFSTRRNDRLVVHSTFVQHEVSTDTPMVMQ